MIAVLKGIYCGKLPYQDNRINQNKQPDATPQTSRKRVRQAQCQKKGRNYNDQSGNQHNRE